MKSERLTTKELERQTGATRHQLMRWAKQGLLPSPKIGWAPTGRGRQGVWSPNVLSTVNYILEQARNGVPGAEIAKTERIIRDQYWALQRQTDECTKLSGWLGLQQARQGSE